MHTVVVANDASCSASSSFTILPGGVGVRVPRSGLYSISASARFSPPTAIYGDLWNGAPFTSALTAAGVAHLSGSRIVAIRLLDEDGNGVDTIEGVAHPVSGVTSNDGLWVPHTTAFVSAVVALRANSIIAFQVWQNSGQPVRAFARFSATSLG